MEGLVLEVGGVYLSSGYGGAGGGGWYGGSGTVPDGSGDDDRGGGGGSGFVWTSSTASSVPSGYSVSSSYYLTDATTYAGNTSFTSTSGSTETGHSGAGYARITLVSGTKKTEITETTNRWNNIEDQKASGTFTGSFNYNGKIITETDTKGNKITHKEHINRYVNSGLILHYDGIDNTGNGHDSSSTIWKDLSGNNNDGTLTSFASPSWDNKGLTFNGTSDYIVTNLNPKEELGENFTISANFKITDTSNYRGVWGYHESSGGGIVLQCNDGTLSAYYGNGSSFQRKYHNSNK